MNHSLDATGRSLRALRYLALALFVWGASGCVLIDKLSGDDDAPDGPDGGPGDACITRRRVRRGPFLLRPAFASFPARLDSAVRARRLAIAKLAFFARPLVSACPAAPARLAIPA